MSKVAWSNMNPPAELKNVLNASPRVHVAHCAEDIFNLVCGGPNSDSHEVAYGLPDGSHVVEAHVLRVRNGIAVNYTDPYMRRRDPDSMVIGDDNPTDKSRFQERFGQHFSGLRKQTLDWLAEQELAIFAFRTGR